MRALKSRCLCDASYQLTLCLLELQSNQSLCMFVRLVIAHAVIKGTLPPTRPTHPTISPAGHSQEDE
ncbi:hypothetical protein J6590_073385 [Homalodisca vitripennis]|nr:hypothetical protein J6590_073385 [Homalodisca vitripennis]